MHVGDARNAINCRYKSKSRLISNVIKANTLVRIHPDQEHDGKVEYY